MSQDTALALWALLALQAKHYVCDFVVQSEYQVRTKAVYGHFGGFIHSGLHILGTIPALIVLGAPPATGALILIVEFAIHYHTDWSKAFVDRVFHWGPTDQRYWIAFGTDQLVHQLTYLGIVYVLLTGMIG